MAAMATADSSTPSDLAARLLDAHVAFHVAELNGERFAALVGQELDHALGRAAESVKLSTFSLPDQWPYRLRGGSCCCAESEDGPQAFQQGGMVGLRRHSVLRASRLAFVKQNVFSVHTDAGFPRLYDVLDHRRRVVRSLIRCQPQWRMESPSTHMKIKLAP